MPSPDSRSHLAAIALPAVLAAAVVGIVYLAGEWRTSPTQTSGPSLADSLQSAVTPQRQPLPAEVTTLEATWDLAARAARAWRNDAKLTLLYASDVGRDGSIDRTASSVQYVFLSQEATSAGPPVMNGYRWAVSRGQVGGVEIMQQPAPDLSFAEPKLCSLASMLGQDAPERVMLDVRYARPAGRRPSFQVFADMPEKWLLIADPWTCQVQMRSQRTTAQEAAEASAAPSAASGHATFDSHAASTAVDAVLSRASSCGRADAGATATLSVGFANDGSVAAVDVEPSVLNEGPYFACIAQRIRTIRIAPWQQGAGRVVRRLPF